MRNLSGIEWLNSKERRRLDLACTGMLLPAATAIGGIGLGFSRMLDGPSPLFTQQRIGRNGDLFNIYKIRTMTHHDIHTTGKGHRDPRATPFGTLLRFTGFDELPQLYNILSGDMSVVGPRPILPVEHEQMQQTLVRNEYDQWFDAYAAACPGIISSFGHFNRREGHDHEELLGIRAKLDVYDFEQASPEHDRYLCTQVGATMLHLLQRELMRPTAQ